MNEDRTHKSFQTVM